MASSMDVSHIEDWNCAFDMIDNLEDLFDSAPEFLLTRRLDSHKGRLRLVHPRESGVFLLFLFVSPYRADTFDHTCEYVSNLFVCFGTGIVFCIWSNMTDHVPSIDNLSNLHARFHLRQRSITIACGTQKFAVIRPMHVHFELRFVTENTSLPVLIEVMWLNLTDGLNLHRLQAKNCDVVHSFDDGSALARERNTGRSKSEWHTLRSSQVGRKGWSY